MGRDFAQCSREPRCAKPVAVAGAGGGRWIEAAIKSLVDQAMSLLCLSAITCNGFSHLCDTWRQQDPTLVAAISSASPQAPAVPGWPLLPTAVVPTCFQTFNLLTLRKPWEAGKVVLSSFYSGKHEWFPHKCCSSWHRGGTHTAYLPRLSPREGGQLSAAHLHLHMFDFALLNAISGEENSVLHVPPPRGPAFRTLPPPSSLRFPLRVSTMKHSS